MDRIALLSVFSATASLWTMNLMPEPKVRAKVSTIGCAAGTSSEHRDFDTSRKLGPSNPCVDNNCAEDRTEYSYHCKKKTEAECGSYWDWSDDDYRYRRPVTYFTCPKPSGTVWRVLCGQWSHFACCTNGVNSAPPATCEGSGGEVPCGSNGQPGVN